MQNILVIEGIALAPVITAITELAKKLGLEVKYAPWLNLILAVAGFTLMMWIEQNPAASQPIAIGINALVIFLTAAGVYDRAQAILTRPA